MTTPPDSAAEAHPIQACIQSQYARIEAATTPQALIPVCQQLREAAVELYREGLRSDALTGIVARWNDAVTQRLLALHDDELHGLRWCWMALGSEGRLEQTLATDQDNALIFEHPDPAAVRARILPLMTRINEWLDRCGYAWCKGGVMASNPKWCLSLSEWQDTFANWIDHGDPRSLLHGQIFFDFRGIAGDLGLVENLRGWLGGYLAPRPVFLGMMAAESLRNHPPLTPWRSLRGRRINGEKVLDIKLNGVTMLVDAARILALAHGDTATATVERLRNFPKTREDERNMAAWSAAYQWLQDLRIRHQFDQLMQGQAPDNLIRLETTSRFDRRVLVAALVEAGRAQDSLRIRYQL